MQNYPRIGGLFILAIASGFGKFFVYDVWQAALAHQESISFSLKATVFSIVFAIVGAMLVILGDTYNKIALRPGTAKQLTPAGWVITLGAVGLGFAGAFYFQSQLESLGYTF